MNVVKCRNGDYFDADKYELCPHCGAASIIKMPAKKGTDDAKNNKSGLFRKKRKSEVEIKDVAADEEETFGIFEHGSEDADRGQQIPEEEKSVGYYGDIVMPPQPPEQPQKKPQGSLQNALKEAVGDEGKTRGYFSLGEEQPASNESTAPGAPRLGTVTGAANPVVGWLVGIKGKHLGESFPLVTGRNAVGRGTGNDVVLNKDQAVSREKQCFILYEPKKRQFFIQPGESSSLTYLNDENVMAPQEMKAMDRIEMGSTVLIFVPLCSERFDWEEVLKEAKSNE